MRGRRRIRGRRRPRPVERCPIWRCRAVPRPQPVGALPPAKPPYRQARSVAACSRRRWYRGRSLGAPDEWKSRAERLQTPRSSPPSQLGFPPRRFRARAYRTDRAPAPRDRVLAVTAPVLRSRRNGWVSGGLVLLLGRPQGGASADLSGALRRLDAQRRLCRLRRVRPRDRFARSPAKRIYGASSSIPMLLRAWRLPRKH